MRVSYANPFTVTETRGRFIGAPNAAITSGGTSTAAPPPPPASNFAPNCCANAHYPSPVPSVADLRQRMQSLFKREAKPVVPRTILVVDGNAASRRSTAGLVEQMGYQALQTASVADALSQLETQEPEFALLGFELDDADGLGALSQIREIDAELPIIMLAADVWDTRVAEAMRRGAVAYLARPFGLDDLRELLGRR